jgi:antitoxin component YwqK of YwqJK toxin-antitoxin module
VFAKDGNVGRLAAIITWNRGVKDGKELDFAEDGKKEVTELYLNGNPKLKEIHESPKRKLVKEFWDTGKVSREGAMVACGARLYRAWCEDGVHRSYFENGARRSEVTYRMGKRDEPSLGGWDNGRRETVAAYAHDKVTEAKSWDRDGKLVADDRFEAEGSRKLRR